MKSKICAVCLGMSLIITAGMAFAKSSTAQLFLATPQGAGAAVGEAVFMDLPDGGVEIITSFYNLPSEIHGFHIHENGDCSASMHDGTMTPAQAAGGHYDPLNTGKHMDPDGGGHAGDLPWLVVDEDGKAEMTMVVMSLNVSEIKGRALMIHAGGDNYADLPEELCGVACGVVN